MITYPLNNIDYTAEDAELFHCTRTSGIWAEDSFSISVTGADNNVTIGTGIAWINNEEFSGKVAALKSAEVLDLGIADGVYPRIDVIAIQYSANNNETDVVIKKGTPATNPVQPAIVRSGAVYELYLASIYRPAGATVITASNITDLRMDATVCGLMADSVTKVDMDAIHAQLTGLVEELEEAIQNIDVGEVVPIEKGGTNAQTSAEARQNINFIGRNPIASLEEDTTATWAAFGTGVAFVDVNGVITNMPNPAGGFIFNQITDGLVHQVWYGMNGSAMTVRYRAGNSNGWYPGTEHWVKGLTENNGAQIKKLWQNAKPTSAFGKQTISINSVADYNLFVLASRFSTGNAKRIVQLGQLGVNEVQCLGNLDNTTNILHFYRRWAIYEDGNVTFNDCGYRQGATANTSSNEYIIPVELYGIKGVQ